MNKKLTRTLATCSLSILSLVVFGIGQPPAARAATDVFWSSTGVSNVWTATGNWIGGTPPVNTTDFATGSTAVFNQTSYAAGANTPSTGTTSIYGLKFGDGVTSTAAITVTRSASQFLTIGAGGVDVNANSGAVSLTNGTIRLDGNQTWSNDSGSLLTVSSATTNVGDVSPVTLSLTGAGAGNTTISGIISNGGVTGTTAIEVDRSGGFVSFTGANTFTGGLTIKAGMAQGGTSLTALGAGPITLGVTGGDDDARLNLNFFNMGPASNAVTVASGAGLRTISATQNTGLTGLVTLNNDLTLYSNGQNITMSGGFTGTGNLTFTGDAASRSVNLTDAPVAINGTITNSGANTGVNTITGGVGSGVTAITQNGNGPLNITTNALEVNSGGTTLTLTSTGGKQLALQGGTTGTGNLILKNDNSTITSVTAPGGGILVSALEINHSGAVINSGSGGTSTGSGVGFSAPVGSNITEIRQASATSTLSVSGAMNVNSTALTLRNTLGGIFNVTSGTATSGTGNVILKNDSTLAGGITVTGAGFNHTGLITNSGTGSGNVLINASIGENVTGLVQDSATSTLSLTAANTYSGDTTVIAGTLALGTGAQSANSLQNSTLDTGAAGSQNVTFASNTVTYNLGGLKGANDLAIGGNTMSVGANNQNTAYSGVLSGTGRLTKVGDGTLTLSSANTYTGSLTTISAGTLLVNAPVVAGNSGTGTSGVVVSGGTLGGNGIIRPGTSRTISVDSGASISPGDSGVAGGIGVLTLDGGGTTSALLTMASGAEFNFQLGAGLTSDRIDLWNYASSADFVRNNNVINISASLDAVPGFYTLFSFYNDDGVTGVNYGFSSGLALNFVDPSMSGYLSYDFSEITLVLDVIPEPSVGALLLACTIGWVAIRRRSRVGAWK